MKRTAVNLIYKDLKFSIVIGVFTGILLYLIFGVKIFLSYNIGFIVGCLNFITLAYGINSMMNLSPVRAKGAYLFTFVMRYAFIVLVFASMVKQKDANIFALTLGLISINTSIKIRAFYKMDKP